MPAKAEEDVLVMLSDILPTGFECGVLNGKAAIKRLLVDSEPTYDEPWF